MRIGIDARSALSESPRGEGQSLLRLYREIARLRPGWDYYFLGTPDADARLLREAVPGAHIVTFGLPGFRWDTWETIGAPWQALRHGFDVYHGFSSGTPAYCPARRVIMTVHDIIPLIFDDGLAPLTVKRFRARLAAGLRSSDRIISVSRNTRDDLLRLYPRLDPGKVDVIHWGASTQPARGVKAAPPAGRSGRHRVLAFAGGGARRKNALRVVSSFALLARDVPDVTLTVVGATNAAERASMGELSQALGVAGRVELHGFVPDDEMERIFATSVCLAYLSLYEGFGLPPLEAMARGVPVVASDRSSIPEIVGDAGLLVDPQDDGSVAEALRNVILSESAWVDLQRRGQQRAATFCWQATAQATIRVLEGRS